jgi:hypothetical protein
MHVIPLPSPLMRIALAVIGTLLLWFGASQISVAGLLLMLLGLVTAVGALSMPRLPLPRMGLPRHTA